MSFTYRNVVQRKLTHSELDENFQEVENLYDSAMAAVNLANINVNLFDNTTVGLSNTSDGDYFSTPSVVQEEYLNLYKNDNGSAVLVKTYLIPDSSDFVLKDGAGNVTVNSVILTVSLGNPSISGIVTESGDGISKRSTPSEFRAAVTDLAYLPKTNPQLVNYTEVPNLSATDSLDVADGSIQVLTLTGASTLAITIASGQSLTLHINGGDTYAVTWPTVTWVDGTPPVLTSADVIQFWKVGTTLFAAYSGSV